MGSYRVLRKLAAGGMSEVFVAKRVGACGFEKAVAVKRLLPELASDPPSTEDFLREARLCSQLSHPGVVQVLDFGLAGGLPFLVMELVDGPDLWHVMRAALRAGEPLTAEEAIHIVACVADALAYAWDARGPEGAPLHVVHRDVNPMNVLVSLDGVVKLADFGVARREGDGRGRTLAGAIKGKLGYIAPELASGGEPTHRGDIFLAGALLWEMLAGEPLFRHRGDPAQCLAELLSYDDAEVPEPICEAREVWPVLRQALARDPAARHGHAGELAAALREVLARRHSQVGAAAIARRMRSLFPDWRPLEATMKATGRLLSEDTASFPRTLSRTPARPCPARPARRQRIGELLVQRGAITTGQLRTILARQRSEGRRVGEWAIGLELAPERAVLGALASQLGVPFLTDEGLRAFRPPRSLVAMLPEASALRLQALPVAQKEGWVYVAMSDPSDADAWEEVSGVFGPRCRPILCTELGLRRVIARTYGRTDPARPGLPGTGPHEPPRTPAAAPEDGADEDATGAARLQGLPQPVAHAKAEADRPPPLPLPPGSGEALRVSTRDLVRLPELASDTFRLMLEVTEE